MPSTDEPEQSPPWWKRWFVQPVINQLTQGITPDKLGWTIAAGIVLGIFPIMGSTTFLCLIAAWLLKLNQPIIQVACHAVYALHLALILVFIRAGQWIFQSDPINLSIPQLISQFTADPWQFIKDFSLAAGQGIIAWALVAPILFFLIKALITPFLTRLATRVKKQPAEPLTPGD
ncbi:MAG: DUF2062 domain-containing protein [Akkermansiaceae bacterium]